MSDNIILPRATVEQALEALEGWDNYGKWVWPESALEQAKRNTTEAITALRAALAQPNPAQRVVDEQAEDEGLWFRAQTAAEAYLQQELRRLHAAVEGEK